MCQAIDSVTQEIEKATTATIEWGNAIDDIDLKVFDLVQKRISDIADESNFLIELLSHKELYDDKGKLTEQGAATLALHGLNINTYMYSADDYANKIAEIDRRTKLDKNHEDYLDPLSQDVIDKRKEYVELQRECILNAKQEEQAIVDLVQEGIDLELDSLSELIDKYTEALNSQKDLYNYQLKVRDITEEISSLEKQYISLQNDDSEESKAKRQQIAESLKESREELQQTEYEKFISDTEALLDDLFLQYQNTLNERIDNTGALIQQVIDGVNAVATLSTEQNSSLLSALGEEGSLAKALGVEGAIASAIVNAVGVDGSIKKILSEETKAVGADLSTEMNNIWTTEGKGTNSILSTYGADFQTKQTTTNSTLDNIKANIEAMVDDVDKDAQKKINAPETKPAAQQNPAPPPASSNNDGSSDGGSGKPAITNDVLMGIAAAIWTQGKKAGWENNPNRKNKLVEKLGADNAKKVQEYINKYGASGGLYKHWYGNNLKLANYSYSAFKLGARKIDETQLAWTQEQGQEYIVRPSDGAILTPVAKGDSVLTSAATNNIWQMANNPTEFIKDNLNLGNTNVPNNSSVQNSVTQNLENVTFSFPNVHSYNEMLTQMQRDKSFERLIMAMTIDKLAGGSSLAKGKAIR